LTDHRRARLLLGSLVLTFGIVRLLLWRSPDADFEVAGASYLLSVSAGGVLVVVGLAWARPRTGAGGLSA